MGRNSEGECKKCILNCKNLSFHKDIVEMGGHFHFTLALKMEERDFDIIG